MSDKLAIEGEGPPLPLPPPPLSLSLLPPLPPSPLPWEEASHHAGTTQFCIVISSLRSLSLIGTLLPLNCKFVVTNALVASPGFIHCHMVPGCDRFSLMFNPYDKYNRRLKDKSWPHHCYTAELQEHNFLLTCVIVNCYHTFLNVQRQTPDDLDYKTFGEDLAGDLFLYACVL